MANSAVWGKRKAPVGRRSRELSFISEPELGDAVLRLIQTNVSKWSTLVVSLVCLSLMMSGCRMGQGTDEDYAMVIMGLIVFGAGVLTEKASVALAGVALWYIG